MDIRFDIRSWRRHRIGKMHILAVIERAEAQVVTTESGAVQVWWFGTDLRGREVEVMAVVGEDDSLYVIHAMALHFRRPRGTPEEG